MAAADDAGGRLHNKPPPHYVLLPEATADNPPVSSSIHNKSLAQSVPMLPSAAPALRRLFTIEQLRYRSHEWAWLSNAAFFVASAFIIGSLLFIIGATVSVWPVGVEDDKLTTYAYFLGGTYFCFGAYIGHFEVINVGCSQRRLLAWPSEAVSASGYWGSGLYFVGAVAFEVAVGFNLLAPVTVRHDPLYHVLLDWLPQCVGGMLFTAAALVEFHHNHDATPEHRVWWLCAFYLLGSVFFWVAASLGLGLAAGAFEQSAVGLERWGVSLLYLLGSAAFLIGGWVQMRMWKAQQFGLGFIREVNSVFSAFARPIDAKQQMSIAVYTTTAALCALNLALNHLWHQRLEAVWSVGGRVHFVPERLTFTAQAEELLTDITGLVASHGMLLVATVVHQTPDLHPFDYLLWVMRGVSAALLASAGLRCARYLGEAGVVEPEQHAEGVAAANVSALMTEVLFALSSFNRSSA